MDTPNPDNRGEFFDQFLDDYYAECDEHLFSIRRSLVVLEDEVDSGTADRILLESYLRQVREGRVALSQPGFEALAAGVSLLGSVINARRNDQPIPSVDVIAERVQSVSADSAPSKVENLTTSDSP